MTTNKPILIALGFVVATGVIGSVFSPQNVINILGFCGFITVSLVGLVKAGATAEKVEEVKVDLKKTSKEQSETLSEIKDTGEKVHILVNSNMGIQLRLNAVQSRRLADITKNPDDIKAAALAQSMLEEHEKKQAVVDAHASH